MPRMSRWLRSCVLGIVALVACDDGVVDADSPIPSLSVVVASQKIATATPATRVEIHLRGPSPDETVRTEQAAPGEPVDVFDLQVGRYAFWLEGYAGSQLVWRTLEVQVTVAGNETTTVSISDRDFDDAPEVQILAPQEGYSRDLGMTVALSATATDEEDGDVTGNIRWSSDLDGSLGTGRTLEISLESVGMHTLTASVSDAGGLTDDATVRVEMKVPELVQLTAGESHTCGLTTSGAAYCWGGNFVGQLGNGDTISRLEPEVVLGGRVFTALTAGNGHTCGLTDDGAAYCWGLNSAGQLGTGETTNQPGPVEVSGGRTFSSISAGGVHTCAVGTAGAAYCWGSNSSGALGDGTGVESSIPVPVSGRSSLPRSRPAAPTPAA